MQHNILLLTRTVSSALRRFTRLPSPSMKMVKAAMSSKMFPTISLSSLSGEIDP